MKNLIQPDPNLLLPLHILFKIQATGIFYGSPAEIILHNFQIFIFSIFQNLFLSNDVDQRRSKTVRSHFCGREFVGACRLSLPTPVQLDQRTSRQTHLRENLQSANTCAQVRLLFARRNHWHHHPLAICFQCLKKNWWNYIPRRSPHGGWAGWTGSSR